MECAPGVVIVHTNSTHIVFMTFSVSGPLLTRTDGVVGLISLSVTPEQCCKRMVVEVTSASKCSRILRARCLHNWTIRNFNVERY